MPLGKPSIDLPNLIQRLSFQIVKSRARQSLKPDILIGRFGEKHGLPADVGFGFVFPHRPLRGLEFGFLTHGRLHVSLAQRFVDFFPRFPRFPRVLLCFRWDLDCRGC